MTYVVHENPLNVVFEPVATVVFVRMSAVHDDDQEC